MDLCWKQHNGSTTDDTQLCRHNIWREIANHSLHSTGSNIDSIVNDLKTTACVIRMILSTRENLEKLRKKKKWRKILSLKDELLGLHYLDK